MDTKEKHVRENAPHKNNYETPDEIAQSMTASGKNKKRDTTAKNNRLWIWLGVIVLIFILLYWLFSIGLFEDSVGFINGN